MYIKAIKQFDYVVNENTKIRLLTLNIPDNIPQES